MYGNGQSKSAEVAVPKISKWTVQKYESGRLVLVRGSLPFCFEIKTGFQLCKCSPAAIGAKVTRAFVLSILNLTTVP